MPVSYRSPHRRAVVLGIDVGSTGVTAAAFALDGSWRHVVVRGYPTLAPAPGWRVQDPDVVLGATYGAVYEVVSACAAAAGGAEVVAVAMSSAMHGLIGLGRDLSPSTPLVTRADSRSADEARDLRASGQSGHLHKLSGTPVHPMTPLCKLMWFMRHEPYLCRRTRWWVGLKDYVLHSLTGTLATELSSASATGLLDLHRRAWSRSALDLAGVSESQLPPILATTAVLRLSAGAGDRTGIPAGTPVVAGAGDGPLSNVGAAAIAEGIGALSWGETGAVRVVVPAPVVDDHEALFCQALTADAWVVGGAVDPGDTVPGDTVPGSTGTPSAAADPDLVRAAVEGVRRQLRTVLERVDAIAPVNTVHLTGEVFRSPLWRTVMAAALDRPVHAYDDAGGSALGAAVLGLHAVGYADDLHTALAHLRPPAAAHAAPPDLDP